jgi:hypothetical protein
MMFFLKFRSWEKNLKIVSVKCQRQQGFFGERRARRKANDKFAVSLAPFKWSSTRKRGCGRRKKSTVSLNRFGANTSAPQAVDQRMPQKMRCYNFGKARRNLF